MHAALRAFVVLPVAATVLAGCFWRRDKAIDCKSVQEYQASQSATLLQTPPDLRRAETTPMTIPEVPGSLDASQVACLERPPKFFDRPPAAAPPGGAPLPPPAPRPAPPGS